MAFQLNDDDVVSILIADQSFTKTPVSKVSQLKAGLQVVVKPFHPYWVNTGLPCEVLRTDGRGWQKGKVQLHVVFTPDEPDEPAPGTSDAVRSPNQ